MQMQIHMEMEIDMEMEMVEMVILKLRRRVGISDLHRQDLCQTLRLRRSVGHQQAIRRAPGGSRRSLRRLVRGFVEVLWELLEVHKAPQATILDTFIVSRAYKSLPGGPQITSYRPCRRFRISRRGTSSLYGRVSRG